MAPILIDQDRQLDRFCRAIADADVVAVDTESDSFYSYREQVCLLQVSVAHEDFLLDPLALKDLTPFFELLENERVTKIFHAAENDVILLKYHLGVQVRSIFDTLIAAQVVGIKQCSLAGLLDHFFGITLSKKEQRSDWRRRPLTRSQIHYAALDTHYLFDLREKLEAMMTELNRHEEAEWDFRALETKKWAPRPFRTEDFARMKGARDLDPVGVRVLRDLYVLRNEIAERTNTAPFRVLTDGTLLDLARRKPRDASTLEKTRSFPRRCRPELRRNVLKTITEAVRAGALPLPVPERTGSKPRLTTEETKTYDALRKWRDRKAEERGVLSYRVTKNDLLIAVVKARPTSIEELEGVQGMDPWRAKEYGAEILELLA